MSYLPLVGWADVATKLDLNLLRGEMATLRAELRTEMATLSGDLRSEMAGLKAEMHRGFATQLRWLVGTMVAMTAIFGTIVTIAG